MRLDSGGCDYKTTEAEYTCRHIALVHCKLEEFLQDPETIRSKAKEFNYNPPEAHIEMFAKRVTTAEGSSEAAAASGGTLSSPTAPTTPNVELRKSSRQRTTTSRIADSMLSEAPVLKNETEKNQTQTPKRKAGLESNSIFFLLVSFLFFFFNKTT